MNIHTLINTTQPIFSCPPISFSPLLIYSSPPPPLFTSPTCSRSQRKRSSLHLDGGKIPLLFWSPLLSLCFFLSLLFCLSLRDDNSFITLSYNQHDIILTQKAKMCHIVTTAAPWKPPKWQQLIRGTKSCFSPKDTFDIFFSCSELSVVCGDLGVVKHRETVAAVI